VEKNEFIEMLETYLKTGDGELKDYFGRHINLEVNTGEKGKGWVIALSWLIPPFLLSAFESGSIGYLFWIIFAFVITIVLLSGSTKKDKEPDERIKELLNENNTLCEKKVNTYLKKHNINKTLVKNLEIIKSKGFKFDYNIVQYIANKKEIIFFCLPIEKTSFKLMVANETYLLNLWNDKKETKPITILKEDIATYTYHGTEIVNIEGSGGDLDVGGAIMGGVLFGGVGALLGGKTATKVTSTKEDLREVQINTTDNKSIIVKGFDLYQDLINYFPDKELKNTVKESKVNKKSNKSVDSLKQLKEMLDDELITQEEYNKKKEEILSKLN